MRLGVLDVGSNTVHLLVVDAHRGAAPVPAASEKVELHLAQLLAEDGRLTETGADRLVAAVRDAREAAERLKVADLVAFATSAMRDATNAASVLARVRVEAGLALEVLPGEDEARLTFLAVRRWFGWSSGRLLVLDIGGGSLEVASGVDEEPDIAASLALGASRLTREFLRHDPPRRQELVALKARVRAELARLAPQVVGVGDPDRAVATSKTFRSLARITGAAPYGRGPYVRRVLNHALLAGVLPGLLKSTAAERAGLPGVSPGRASQLLAGALVADAAMDAFGIEELQVCPWALREGVILRRLDYLAGG